MATVARIRRGVAPSDTSADPVTGAGYPAPLSSVTGASTLSRWLVDQHQLSDRRCGRNGGGDPVDAGSERPHGGGPPAVGAVDRRQVHHGPGLVVDGDGRVGRAVDPGQEHGELVAGGD